MERRGFINYDIWIVGVVLLLVGSIVVSQVDRRIRRRRERAAAAYLARVATYERDLFAAAHTYGNALPPALVDSTWLLVQFSGDSTGWGIWLRGPAKGWIQVTCGMYGGSDQHAPLPGMAAPGEVTCE